MVSEILAAVERAAEEADVPFLRHKTAAAPQGLLGAEELYNLAFAAETVREAIDVAATNMRGSDD